MTASDLEITRQVLERRARSVEGAGVTATTQGTDLIVLVLPQSANRKRLLHQLTARSDLRFYIVPELGNRNRNHRAAWSIRMVENPATHRREELLFDAARGKPVTPANLQRAIFARRPSANGRDFLPRCQAVLSREGMALIEFEMRADRGRDFEMLTRSHIGSYLAVFLDRKLLTAPVINGPIPGKGILEGNFTIQEARDLAAALNAGALPADVEAVRVERVAEQGR